MVMYRLDGTLGRGINGLGVLGDVVDAPGNKLSEKTSRRESSSKRLGLFYDPLDSLARGLQALENILGDLLKVHRHGNVDFGSNSNK